MAAKKKTQSPSEYKAVGLPFEATKVVSEDEGIVETILTVFGIPDKGFPPDISHPGSFTKTIAERGPNVLVLDQHNTDSVMRVLGKPLEIREVGKHELPEAITKEFPEATGGVKATIQFFLDTPEGLGAFKRIKNGGLREWSYGYDALDSDVDTVKFRDKSIRVRNLRTIKLYEMSPVLWGMAESHTMGAKANQEGDPAEPTDQPKAKAVTPYLDLDLAERDLAWSGSEAEKRVREWAGGDDLDWEKYSQAFLWHDGEEPEALGSYKLGYADVVEGKLVAVPRALFTLTNPARGLEAAEGIPADEQEKIKTHVGQYFEKMRAEFADDSLVPAWDKALPAEFFAELPEGVLPGDDEYLATVKAVGFSLFASDQVDKAEALRAEFPQKAKAKAKAKAEVKAEVKGQGSVYLSDYLQATLHFEFTKLADYWYKCGLMNREERLQLSSLIGDALDVLNNGMPAGLAMLELHGTGYYDYGYMSQEPEAEIKHVAVAYTGSDSQSFEVYIDGRQVSAKAGRTLSASNARKIQAALAALNEVLMAAGAIGSPTTEEMEEDDDSDKSHEEAGNTKATSDGAGPNTASPTPDDLVRLIEIEQAELDWLTN